MSQRGEKPRAKLWSTGLILSLLVLLVPLGIGGGGGGGIIPPDIFSYSFIIQAPALNTYAAYRTGISAMTPFATESNFTKLVYDDIIRSSFCAMGCSINLNSGNYNQTQKIPIDRQGITITGTSASIIYPQGFNTPAFNVTAPNFVLRGLRIDDFNRRFISQSACTISALSGTPCHIAIAEFSGNCVLDTLQIFNMTAAPIYLTASSSNCIVAFSTLVGIPAQFTNASIGAQIGIVAAGMGHRIEFNSVSYMVAGAGIQIGRGTINNALHSSAIGNTLFHNEYGIQFNSAIDAKAVGNTIYNSTSHGIFVTTGLIASTFGPLVISGNTISESGQGLCCGANPGASPHIQLTGSRCCWYSVSITGNTMLDRQATLTTQYDILMASVNYRNLTITGNSVGKALNNPVISLAVNPPDKSWIITANPGFNAAPKRGLVAGASPYTYTNNDAYMEQLELTNVIGLTGLVCRGNNQVIAVNALTSVLNTVDTCVFTWAGTAPEFDVLPLQG